MFSYVRHDLVRNPRRTVASLVGVVLGVGLFSGVLFFIDGSGATMTKRAIAPVALDMQRVLTSPLGRRLTFQERLDASSPLTTGAKATVTLTVINEGADPANEVVVNDEPPPPLSYVQGTTTLNGELLPDQAGQSPLAQGLSRSGLNLGTLAPGAKATLTYVARANRSVHDLTTLQPRGRISSREDVVPLPANAAAPLTIEQLASEIGKIPGVAAADGLYFVDLPPGSLRANGSTVNGPARVFAFDPSYRAHYPSVRVASGSITPGAALVSAEAARSLGAAAGETLAVTLPGDPGPMALPVSGVVDLARATPLFSSRKSSKLEDFLYVPNSVVVSPETFERTVLPAFKAASAEQGTLIKNLPVLEVDVLVDRARLHTDPGRALEQTKAIARSIERVAPGQDYLIDNISNTLEVARDDAAIGKRMFLFLGLPGALLAAFLTSYTGSILARTQSRERANLRLRGAQRSHLLQVLGYQTGAVAVVGSAFGATLGFVSAIAILGWDALSATAPRDLVISGLVALAVGTVCTALALYVAGRRTLRHEIGEERRELTLDPTPTWRRWHLDVVLLAIAAIAAGIAFRVGAFDAPPTSVAAGQSPSLPSYLLLAPLVGWIGGTLFLVRVVQAVTRRFPLPTSPQFGPVVRGTLSRSLRRRSWAVAAGVLGVGLIVAFAVNLAIFAATYDDAKAADARFVVGSDLRITPSPLSTEARPPEFAPRLEVPGVAGATPIVSKLENAVLIGPYDQDRADLTAIDPRSFAEVAALSDSFFVDGTAADAMAALAADPQALLVQTTAADDLSIEPGDDVRVLLARGTEHQVLKPFHVVGRFDRFPGFPQGTTLVANLGYYEVATGLHQADFFLARASDQGPSGVTRAAAALQDGPGQDDPLNIDTTKTALNKDQSSLTALDIHSLVRLDLLYTLLMSAACMAIFVFGLMLQRRREYVTLRAQGMPIRQLRALVLGEAGLVAVCGLVTGVVVGIGVAYLFVHILRPLFVLDPPVTLRTGRLVLVAAVPIAAMLAAAFGATAVVRRLKPTELLRET
jgi:putative ABC transport system permease protein